MTSFFQKLFGASWRTSLFGFIAVASAFVVQNPDILSSIMGKHLSQRIFSIASLISGFVAFKYAKDKNVVGGNTQSTLSGAVADKGTASLVDATLVATVKSGEPITSDQREILKTIQ